MRDPPSAAIADALLDASRINLVMDNRFLREAGALGWEAIVHGPFHRAVRPPPRRAENRV